MLKLLNTLTVEGKTFTEEDRVNTFTYDALGLPDDWYGGNAKKYSYLQTNEGFYMLMDRYMNIVNLAYDEDTLTEEGRKLLYGNGEKPLEEMELKELKERATSKGIEFAKNASRETMLELLRESV